MLAKPLPASAFVPHRPPLLLVDEVLAHGPSTLTARLTVRDEPPFGDGEGGVPAYLGIEYMAQTIAAYSGMQRAARGLAPSIGLLVGSRRYVPSVMRFIAGSTLTVSTVEKLSEYADMNVFACRIADETGSVLAEADIKAYQPEDIAQYLESHP